MKLFAVIALLALGCTAAHGQKVMEKIERDPPKNTQKKEAKKSPPAQTRAQPEPRPHRERREDKRGPMTASPSSKFPSEQATRVAPVRPTTPPSRAEQLQRQIEEDRRLQRREQRASEQSGAFRCSAHPVCRRSTGGYGSCQGVEQTFSGTTFTAARRQIAQQCAAANNPDSCNCTAQCSQVAHCSSI